MYSYIWLSGGNKVDEFRNRKQFILLFAIHIWLNKTLLPDGQVVILMLIFYFGISLIKQRFNIRKFKYYVQVANSDYPTYSYIIKSVLRPDTNVWNTFYKFYRSMFLMYDANFKNYYFLSYELWLKSYK